jgi:DNA mismatch repair protein MutS
LTDGQLHEPEKGERSGKTAGASAIPAIDPSATPSMRQYLEIKTANPDSLLWYRMGDFYELFFQDAVVASEALGIVLTKRGKHLGEDIPMCGVPVARADEYLQRLIRQGFRVAVCEQLEDPAEARKRGAKAVVKRDVVRLVTPGTLTEETLLDARARNYLIALFPALEDAANGEPATALAVFELSTGESEIGLVLSSDLPGEIARLLPREILIPDTIDLDEPTTAAAAAVDAAITPVPTRSFDSLSGETNLRDMLGVSDLAAFGAFTRAELAAAGALLRYVDLTQVGQKPVLRPPRRIGAGATLVIDAATRMSLELVRSTSGERRGSLLAAMDRTLTGAGARELAARISAPLIDPAEIDARLDATGFLLGHDLARGDLRDAIRQVPDVARAVSRLSLNRGGPRDLGAVRDALLAAAAIGDLLDRMASGGGLPNHVATIRAAIEAVPPVLSETLAAALADELPHQKRDGGYIRSGYSADLDQARALRDDSRNVLAALEAKYVSDTDIKALKIKHNNILGYFIEVSATAGKPMLEPPLSDVFRHRQTMANAIRFTTSDLAEIEGRIASAGERVIALEAAAFNDLSRMILAESEALGALSAGLAELDCFAGLAELGAEQNYTRPVVTEASGIAIVGGRHPVVEQALAAQKAGPFIVNETVLGVSDETAYPPGFEAAGNARIWLVTGPNMAGKSTFLRQTALIVLMAQMGSFVPAENARIGVVDRLFSRVGASDDLARGRSTFMVEMVETAAILNQATSRSLVILDEIGRGTATYDGLSIAWATVEHLHDAIGCCALFATHYHEMTALAERLPGVANVTMDVSEYRDEIVFLHRVRPGAADRSYGIQVAKLAGLPDPVVARAGEVLQRLEAHDAAKPDTAPLDDLPLFSATRPRSHTLREPEASPTLEALDDIHPDELSPRAALEALYKLKALRRDEA